MLTPHWSLSGVLGGRYSLADALNCFLGRLRGYLRHPPGALKEPLQVVSGEFGLRGDTFINASASHQPVHAIDIALDTVLSKRHPLCGGVSESVGNVGAGLRRSLEVALCVACYRQKVQKDARTVPGSARL